MSLSEYQEALEKFKGEPVTMEETLRTIRDNKKYMEHYCACLGEDNKGNKYIILEDYMPDYYNRKAGNGGSVGMIATTSSNNSGEVVTIKNCKNFGEVSSIGGAVLTKEGNTGCIIAGNGGSAAGGVGNSNGNVVFEDFENHGHVSANGGGVNLNSKVNVNGIFESLAGKGGSAGGCLGTADDPSASDSVVAQSNDTDQSDDTYRVVFKEKNVNIGKIEAISGENSGNCSGGASGGPLSKGSAGRRVSGLCNGENGDGGCAAGFVAESYVPITFSEGSETINIGDCNANGTKGEGGKGAGVVAFAAEEIKFGGKEVSNEGNISANGETTSFITRADGSTGNGNGGTAAGLAAVAEKDVKMAGSGKASNCGKIEAIGGAPSSEDAVAGIGGTAGAAFGDVSGDVDLTNFTNEESGTVDASGRTDGDKAGSAGILGRARGDTRLVGVINRAAIRSTGNDNGFSGGHASFTSDCDGNITIINSQNMGDMNADGGGTAAIVPRVLPGKKLEISNFGNTGNISAIGGTGGIISTNSGEASLTNTYFLGNDMADHLIRLADISRLQVRHVYSNKENAAGVQSI